MTYRPSHAPRRAIRNILRNFGIRNKAETADIPIERLAKAMRADLQNTRPDRRNLIMAKNTLKHLNAALHRSAGNPSYGSCFHRAAALVLDMAGTHLCIGTFAGANIEQIIHFPGSSPTDFVHAWVEKNNEVYAPTMINNRNSYFGPFPRDLYYEENGARDVKRLSRSELLVLSGRYGLSAHLRHDKAVKEGKKFSVVLLDSAGVRYRVDEGAVLPA